MDKTSITQKPTIDVNSILSDDFDVNTILSPEDSANMSMLNSNALTRGAATELTEQQKMAAFVESVSGTRVDAHANSIAMQAQTETSSNVDAWTSIKNSWKNGRAQMSRADLSWEMMSGERPIEYLDQMEQYPTADGGWFESSINGVTEMMPMMLETTSSGAKYGLGMGAAAAGVAAVAGQAGPQIALPEELITVPSAFVTFAGLGTIYGGSKRAMEIEGGLMFDELLQMKGPNGERIDTRVANSIASGVGLVNGLLEMSQMATLLKTIPGGKKLLKKGTKEAISKAIKSKSLLKLAGEHLWAYGGSVTSETLQELAQESSNIVGGELAKYIHNAESEGKISHADAKEVINRYKETAIQSLQSFSVLAAPGHIGGTVIDVVDQQAVRVKPRVAPDTAITREVNIHPRVDPLTMEAPLLGDQGVTVEGGIGDKGIAQPKVEGRLELEAAFKTKDGATVEVGGFHDISKLPKGAEVSESGFIRKDTGEFLSREEAAEVAGIDKESGLTASRIDASKEAFRRDESGEPVLSELVDSIDNIPPEFGLKEIREDLKTVEVFSQLKEKFSQEELTKGFDKWKQSEVGQSTSGSEESRFESFARRLLLDGDTSAKRAMAQSLAPTQQAEAIEKLSDVELETKVQAELPASISPKLYIGNVTQRMKKKFAEIWGSQETDVRPFMDGPFPTKRSKITMTGDQAMSTLVMLEASLDQRLNDNLIRTENDLAQANADWGDIKEIRKSLGMPKAPRPFTVHRAKYGILTPDQVLGKIGFQPEQFGAKGGVRGEVSAKQRISFSVEKAKADKVTVSRIDQLNNVMRKMRKSAKEGYSAAAKHYREVQYLRKQIQLRKGMVKKIKATPVKGLEPFYAKAIKEMQTAIDFKAKDKKAVAKKEGIKKHIADNPDKATEIPSDILESLDKKNVEELTMAQLQQIADEIKRLEKLGKLKSKLLAKQDKKAVGEMKDVAIKSVQEAKKSKAGTAVKAWTLRMLRLLDMMDGVKHFTGPLVKMFDTQIQDATDKELTNTDHRQQRGMAKMKELGLTMFHFARRKSVGKYTFTVDELCGIYAGWMNKESQLALQHGGVELSSGKAVKITEELYEQVVNTMSDEEIRWSEFIIEEYADNWERIRGAVIEAENVDLGRRTNYTKIRRIGVTSEGDKDILGGFDYSEENNFRNETVHVHDNFIKDRKKIPARYQTPIDASLTRVWQGEIRKQEHYIAMAKLLKDLNSVVTDKDFKATVESKFGKSMHEAMEEYLKRVANPDYYRTFDDMENLSKVLRKNTAVAYLAFNVLTVAKQVPSLMLYGVSSSYSDILMSAIQVATNPKKTYEAVLSHNPQIGHVAISREMEELKHANTSAYKFIIRKVGNAGLRGILEIDRAVRVIGENAVINSQMRQGKSMQEASKKARQTTLRTQPAAGAKDIARLYATDEWVNWFTMFTNQLNQIYNVATYDVYAAWHNKEFAEVGRSAIALSTMAAWIWALQNKEIPDEPDDIKEAMIEQAVGAAPFFGGSALSGIRGWGATTPAPLSNAAKLGSALKSGDSDKMSKALFEATAISTGLPYVGTKRIYETAEEQDLWNLIGGK